jgi:hypothetical protein
VHALQGHSIFKFCRELGRGNKRSPPISTKVANSAGFMLLERGGLLKSEVHQSPPISTNLHHVARGSVAARDRSTGRWWTLVDLQI